MPTDGTLASHGRLDRRPLETGIGQIDVPHRIRADGMPSSRMRRES
jgi:hypothetical protein